jgi:hypothetical protein
MNILKNIIDTTIDEYLNENRLRDINEAYDDVSYVDLHQYIEYIKSKKKLSEYNNYDNKIIIKNNTYLNFIEKDFDWFLWGQIYVFDNEDGTEIANGSYGKEKEYSNMKATIDVRGDKRRTGIASNIYQWIEKLTGDKLHPDTPHTKSAEALWNNPNRKFGFDK